MMRSLSYIILVISIITGGSSRIFAQQSLKVISYNILEGMVRDTTAGKKDFVAWLKQQNPDILALEECNKFTQKSLEEMAHQYGHPYAVLLKETGYPVALTSKYPIVNVHRVLDNMHHGFILARIKDYHVIVLHLSPHKYRKRREEIDVILQTIAAQPSQKRWMIMGDFNSYSPLDKANYADGKTVKWLQDLAKKYPFHDNLIDGQYLDFEVQQKILDFGLIDVLKRQAEKHPADAKNIIPGKNRIDYIYVSKDLGNKVTDARFLRDDFTKTHSDHIPIIIELKN
ncbi:hypothetical protein FW774_16250 [Pedobacter sp. BS3]|nr:hypothetical protein FW774_16250 [Pedobacter sp. BS3]